MYRGKKLALNSSTQTMVPFALLLFCAFSHVQSTNLSIIFVTSFGQHGINSSGVVPAVEMALANINNRSDILPGYYLTFDHVRDSQVII